MYRMALSIFLLPSNFDTSKLIKMALVHDLAESIVGDITPYDGVTVEDKKNRELLAMIEIGKLIPEESKNEIMKLWQEYEDCFTEDSWIVKDLDKFDMILQGFEYEKIHQIDLSSFFEGISVFRTSIIRKWAEEVYEQREKYTKGKLSLIINK